MLSQGRFPPTDMTIPDLLRRSAMSLLVLAAFASLWIAARGFGDIQDYYLVKQDLPLLITGSAAMLVAARTSLVRPNAAPMTDRRTAFAIAVVAIVIAYAGSWLVMERYAMSRDEDMAEFAARYMQQGSLGIRIPPEFGDLGIASLPLSAGRFIAQGYWVSDYLPMNSALRAAAGLLGDRWLAGPLLLALGMVAIWRVAHRLWPAQPEAAIVAIVLAATSTQLVVNAMTPFATTAHFALNAVWIACFLRGGRSGHAAAILVGLVAAGLHQFHFPMLFLSGFIVWMALSGRWRLALLYAVAAICYYLIWDMAWPRLVLGPLFGGVAGTAGAVVTPSQTFLTALMGRLSRFAILEPLTSAARFAAWQNLLLIPLMWVGFRGIRRREDGTWPITLAFAVSILVGLAIMPWQGFGYGYRYLHHLIPCILLMAAAGVVRLREVNAAPNGRLLTASVLFAALVTAPFAMWRSHELLAPFATAYRMARSAPADVVVVNTLTGAYVQDIVRIEDPATRPVLLDIVKLSDSQIDKLCTQRHVMLFDGRAAAAAGLQAVRGEGAPIFSAVEARLARMARLGCATPLPGPAR